MKVWLNGTLLPADAARIAPTDRGFTLGDGVFETIRVTGTRPAHLARHLRRLRDGAAVLGIPVIYADAALAEAIAATVAASGLADAAVRLTLSRGPGERGIGPPAWPRPTTLVTAGSLPPAGGPLHAVVAGTTRRNEFSPLSRIKSLNYLDGVLARREAVERGADEAILLNTRGAVAETSIANLVVLLAGGRLVTPPVADGALPGIFRGMLIERCGVVEATLMPAELPGAEAVVACNSLGVRAVASIDGQQVPVRPDLVDSLERAAWDAG